MSTGLADRLAAAIANRQAIEPEDDGLTPEDAYLVQRDLLERLGGTRVAVKLGLTSRAKQEQMGVSEPLYGWLVDWMRLEPGQLLSCSELIQPRVEPEIAFLIGDTLSGPAVSAVTVLAATEAVLPALDVLDSRYAGYRFTLPDVIADDASAARFLCGDPVPVDGIDLRTVGCVLERNGSVVATAAGAAVLGHPAEAVAWLVRKLAERGESLAAGTTVLAGALTAAVPVEPGDVIGVTIDRIGTLELGCR